jgi:hypothetical protein
MVKNIKLFENWAEEIEVPEYLDSTWEPKYGMSVFDDEVMEELRKPSCKLMYNNSKDYDTRANFKYFHELDTLGLLRPKGYSNLTINQSSCKYVLASLENCPNVKHDLILMFNDVKSLKGLEDKKLRTFSITDSKIEHFKYSPTVTNHTDCSFSNNSNLISLKGVQFPVFYTRSYSSFIYSYCLENDIYDSYTKNYILSYDDMQNVELHGNAFSNYKKQDKAWHQCYYDPNDVENFDFLFLPFWYNSEKFREKAKIAIKDLDVSKFKIDKESLW